MECKICGKIVKNNIGLSQHLYYKHNLSFYDYSIQYDNLIIPKCEFCGDDCKIRKVISFNKTCEKLECKKLYIKKYVKHSEETKNKIRIKRIEFLQKRTGKSAWEKRNNGEFSYLEKWFYDTILIKYNLFNKFDIINEYCIFPYFIDFAFLNIKCAIELDGACHFSNGKDRIEHDIKRDEFLIKNGWTIFRIRYDEIYSNSIEYDILNFLYLKNKDIKVYGNMLYKMKDIYHLKENKRENNKKLYEETQKFYISLIENSNIDFSKFGWVNGVAKIINISSQKVNGWMKRFMLDFYNEKCFKKSL